MADPDIDVHVDQEPSHDSDTDPFLRPGVTDPNRRQPNSRENGPRTLRHPSPLLPCGCSPALLLILLIVFIVTVMAAYLYFVYWLISTRKADEKEAELSRTHPYGRDDPEMDVHHEFHPSTIPVDIFSNRQNDRIGSLGEKEFSVFGIIMYDGSPDHLRDSMRRLHRGDLSTQNIVPSQTQEEEFRVLFLVFNADPSLDEMAPELITEIEDMYDDVIIVDIVAYDDGFYLFYDRFRDPKHPVAGSGLPTKVDRQNTCNWIRVLTVVLSRIPKFQYALFMDEDCSICDGDEYVVDVMRRIMAKAFGNCALRFLDSVETLSGVAMSKQVLRGWVKFLESHIDMYPIGRLVEAFSHHLTEGGKKMFCEKNDLEIWRNERQMFTRTRSGVTSIHTCGSEL